MSLVTVENKATNSARLVNPTLRTLIYKSLYRLNIYSIRETPSDNEVNACMFEFNAMLQDWYLRDIIKTYIEYGLDDSPSLDIGTTNPLYYDDCFVDNLAVRLIELYNIDPASFRSVLIRATRSLDKVANMKEDYDLNNNTFKSNFDGTLRNTPDIDRVYDYTLTE